MDAWWTNSNCLCLALQRPGLLNVWNFYCSLFTDLPVRTALCAPQCHVHSQSPPLCFGQYSFYVKCPPSFSLSKSWHILQSPGEGLAFHKYSPGKSQLNWYYFSTILQYSHIAHLDYFLMERAGTTLLGVWILEYGFCLVSFSVSTYIK